MLTGSERPLIGEERKRTVRGQSEAIDPSLPSPSISCCSSKAGFSPYQSTRLSHTMPPLLSLGAGMRRREFLGVLASAAANFPLAVRAQQAAMPVIGFFHLTSLDATRENLAAFRRGLAETGYIEHTNV